MQYSSSIKRLFAFIIDGVILFFLDFIIGLIIQPGGKINAQFGISFDFTSPAKTLSNIINLLYFIGFTSLWGATLGKKVLGIKVIDIKTESVPSFGKVVLRETIGKIISAAVLGLGFIWAIFDKHKQGWHDKIAGTYVIEARK